MAEFLIKAEASPVVDGPSKWYAAAIVVVAEDGHEWGGKEGPPKFFIIKVPGVTKADADSYLEEWRHEPSYTILQNQQSTDSFRIRLDSNRVSATGKNSFSLAQVESFFTKWDAAIVSVNNESVIFDISIFDAATSEGFWGVDTSGVVFVETTYTEVNGDHLIQIQDSPYTDEQMASAVRNHSGTIVPPDSFIINRGVMRQALQDDIARKIRDISFARRRWYVSATGMSSLVAAGGIITVTAAQFINNVVDGLTD